MFIKTFRVEIENIVQLKIAIALYKIRQLQPLIEKQVFTDFFNELTKEEGVQEMTELEIQDEFLQYVKEVNNECQID